MTAPYENLAFYFSDKHFSFQPYTGVPKSTLQGQSKKQVLIQTQICRELIIELIRQFPFVERNVVD